VRTDALIAIVAIAVATPSICLAQTFSPPCNSASSGFHTLPSMTTTSGTALLQTLAGMPGKFTYIVSAGTSIPLPPVGGGVATVSIGIRLLFGSSDFGFGYNGQTPDGTSLDHTIIYLSSAGHFVPSSPQIGGEINVTVSRTSGTGITIKSVSGCNF